MLNMRTFFAVVIRVYVANAQTSTKFMTFSSVFLHEVHAHIASLPLST